MSDVKKSSIEKCTKVNFKGAKNYRDSFKNSDCLLIISVGQRVHEGEKFSKTLSLIDNSFRSCIIQVDDTLQRYDIEIEDQISMAKAFKKSAKLGDDWISRKKELFEKLTIPYRIIRWNHWLEHGKFLENKRLIEKTYNQDKQYRLSFEQAINKFLQRRKKYEEDLGNSFDERTWFNICLTYLKEECAAMCLWHETRCQYEVYPSGRNMAQIATYERFIEPVYGKLLTSVSLYFR